MRQSQLFGKTLKENPKDEVAANAIFLERGGFIYKTMAGVYDFLPLGLRVLNKVNQIIREEMNAIGGQEMHMTVLQPAERWAKTGRWQDDAITDWFKTEPRTIGALGLAPTHEEAVTEIAARSVFSYKDLPFSVYQLQTKFRREARPKSGLIRGREFLMKDLYSFDRDEAGLDLFYQKVIKAYKKIFTRLGLQTYITEASGGVFSKNFSHEFQVLSPAGEDWLLYCAHCRYAQNKEISTLTEDDACPTCGGKIALDRSIEVGNIFKLGTRFSEAMGLFYSDEQGNKKPVWMGSYGIGPGRLIGTLVEVSHDERGIIWPENVAPFQAHIIELRTKNLELSGPIQKEAEKLYQTLVKKGIEVLYDDRADKTAGEKFADADLLGIPYRIVVSEKTLAKKSVEIKKRSMESARHVSLANVPVFFQKVIAGKR